jgi:hypothetical protein
MSRFIWLSGFRGEDFLELDQSETGMACGEIAHFVPIHQQAWPP